MVLVTHTMTDTGLQFLCLCKAAISDSSHPTKTIKCLQGKSRLKGQAHIPSLMILLGIVCLPVTPKKIVFNIQSLVLKYCFNNQDICQEMHVR